jgi:hypothetical protein
MDIAAFGVVFEFRHEKTKKKYEENNGQKYVRKS